jgi:hypothetical protein
LPWRVLPTSLFFWVPIGTTTTAHGNHEQLRVLSACKVPLANCKIH